MAKGRKRKGAARADSQEAPGKFVSQFSKKQKLNNDLEDSEQSEDIAITEDSVDVTKVDGLKSTVNGTTEIASRNSDNKLEDTQDTVTAHSNEEISAGDEKESLEVTSDVNQGSSGQDTTVVSEPETVEQTLTTVTCNESKPVQIVIETLVNSKASTNDDSATDNEAVMIVEVAADPAVEQKEEVNKQFIDVGIQVDLPTVNTSVPLDDSKATSDPTVTALLDELSSLNRLIMASKRDLEATRRKRDIWMKNNKAIK